MGIFKGLIFASLWVMCIQAWAATYQLPDGNLPAGCTASGTHVNCGSVQLQWHDAVTFTQPNVTWTVDGNLFLSNARINTVTEQEGARIEVSGSVTSDTGATVYADLEAGGTVALNYQNVVQGHINGQVVSLGTQTVVIGSVAARSNLFIDSGVLVEGNVSAAEISGPLDSEGNPQATSDVRIIGNVSATGQFRFYNQSQLMGNVTAHDVLLFAANVRVRGNVQASNHVFLGHGGVIEGDVYANSMEMQDSDARVEGSVTVYTDLIVGHNGVIHGDARAVNITNNMGTIAGSTQCYSSDGSTPETCSVPAAPIGFSCEEFTELAQYGVIGLSGFSYGSNSNMNIFDIEGSGNTPTPTGSVTTVNLSFPPIEPANFPVFGGGPSVTNQENLAPGSYGLVRSHGGNRYISFAGGDYHIDRFETNNNLRVHLGPGNYFIKSMDVGNSVDFVISPEGKVNLFIRDGFDGGNEIYMNHLGSAGNLTLNLYDGAHIRIGNGNQGTDEFNFNGLIYAPSANTHIDFGNNNTIQGGILSSGTINVGQNTQFHYPESMANEMLVSQGCDPVPSAYVDHYRILQPQSVISCVGAPVEVLACANTDCTALYEDPVSVTLSSTPSVRWQGGALPVPVTGHASFSFEGGRELVGMQRVEGGSAAIALAANDPAFAEAPRCYDSSGTQLRDNCTTEFRPAGLLVEFDNTPGSSPVAGVPFNTQVRAVETNTSTGACQARLQNQTRPVRFAAECVNPGSCVDGQQFSLNETAITLGSTVPDAEVELAFDEEGRASAESLYTDAGMLRLHAELLLPEEPVAPGGDISDPAVTLTGTSNDFVSRPYQLVVYALDENGTPVSPTPDDQPGYRAAGETFTVQLQAFNENDHPTPNFGREFNTNLVQLEFVDELLLDSGGFGTPDHLQVDGAFTAEDLPGAVTNNGVRWLEAGSIRLRAAIEGDNYLGGGDIPNRPASEIGRFYPAQIRLSTASVFSECTSFSYLDQPAISLTYTLTAHGATNAPTRNYDSRLYPAFVEFEVVSKQVETTRIVAEPGTFWEEGELNFEQDGVIVRRDLNPDGPFNDLQFGLTGAKSLDPVDLVLLTAESIEGFPMARLGSPLRVVYGRLQLANIGGPEDDDLWVQGQLEYWDGSQFVRHHQDSCSELEVAQLDWLSGDLVPQPGGFTATVNEGVIPPGALYWQSTGDVGEFIFKYDAPPWLKFDWYEDGAADDNPTAIGTFGQFRGNDRIIFWGERLTH